MTDGEHQTLTAEAEQQEMSLSRYLVTAGHVASERLEEEYLNSQTDATRLEELHWQITRGTNSLKRLVAEGRDDESGGATLEDAVRTLERAAGAILKTLSKNGA